MFQKKIISIIISSYNEEKYIENCIKSLFNQTYKIYEIIIVDDGSTDNTKKIIKKYPQVILIENLHKGTAISRNLAVSHAKGDIIVFIDSDMTFSDDFIDKLVDPIIKNEAKGTFSRLEYVANWDKPLARCWNRNSNPKLPDRLRVMPDIVQGEDFRAILKSEFIKVSGFDNTGYTDTWSLSKKLGYKPINAPSAIYYHYNPESFSEVFQSACWIGKREYKVKIIGYLISLIRNFFIFSLIKGVKKSIKYKESIFITFQIIYDFGLTLGTLQKLIFNNKIK